MSILNVLNTWVKFSHIMRKICNKSDEQWALSMQCNNQNQFIKPLYLHNNISSKCFNYMKYMFLNCMQFRVLVQFINQKSIKMWSKNIYSNQIAKHYYRLLLNKILRSNFDLETMINAKRSERYINNKYDLRFQPPSSSPDAPYLLPKGFKIMSHWKSSLFCLTHSCCYDFWPQKLVRNNICIPESFNTPAFFTTK